MPAVAYPSISSNFPGIDLERDQEFQGTSPISWIEFSPEQGDHDAKMNRGLVLPTNEAPLIVDNTVDVDPKGSQVQVEEEKDGSL